MKKKQYITPTLQFIELASGFTMLAESNLPFGGEGDRNDENDGGGQLVRDQYKAEPYSTNLWEKEW